MSTRKKNLQKPTKQQIKDYWEDRLPLRWMSKKQEGTVEHYDEVCDMKYNVYHWHFPRLMEFEQWENKKVLEVGMGVGCDILQYAENGAEVYGIDLTQKSIDTTNWIFKKKNLKGNFQRADAENLPYKDNIFDLVVSTGVLHHTPNTQKAIDEIKRVLKPDGKFIIMLYSKGWKHYYERVLIQGILKGELFRISIQEINNKYSEVEGDSPLTKLYSKKELKKLFKGFNVEHMKKYRALGMKRVPGKPLLNLIHWFVDVTHIEHLIGEHWFIKGRKKS